MKREEILLYISENKFHVYLNSSKEEKIIEKDTSLFFKYGEISNVHACERACTEILSKLNFRLLYLKPNITILYNDVCNADMKYLYKSSLRELNFNAVYFVPLTKLVKDGIKKSNVVVFDENYYTDIDRGEKFMEESCIESEPVYIGKKDNIHIHFSDKDIIWSTFKTYFTNLRTCDKMDVGDDD